MGVGHKNQQINKYVNEYIDIATTSLPLWVRKKCSLVKWKRKEEEKFWTSCKRVSEFLWNSEYLLFLEIVHPTCNPSRSKL